MTHPDKEILTQVIHKARREAHRRLLTGFDGTFDRFIADAVETYLALWISFDPPRSRTPEERTAAIAEAREALAKGDQAIFEYLAAAYDSEGCYFDRESESP